MAPQDIRFEDIRFELDEGIAVITLDRPEHRNTFTGAMGRELGEAYTRCDADDDVRVVVVTGAGRAFCAGADMSGEADTFGKQEGDFSAAAFHPPAFEVRKPVIAAVNGHAVGIGLTLALQCDMRFMAREGKYGVLQVRRGILPDAYSHWTLPRLVGLSKAADLMLSGRTFRGDEAAELGIATRVLPADEVLDAAIDRARDIARHTAPLSVALCKRLLWESPQLDPAAVERKETELHHHLMGREDAIEGVMAYLEKRDPRWRLSVCRDWPDEWPE